MGTTIILTVQNKLQETSSKKETKMKNKFRRLKKHTPTSFSTDITNNASISFLSLSKKLVES